jgi:hypothetical protein
MTQAISEQLAYFRDVRKNSLCVVNNETGKVFKTFPRSKMSDAVKWCSRGVELGQDLTMFDVKHKDGMRMVFTDRPEPTARERAATRSQEVNGI